jgi:hypothetical protein
LARELTRLRGALIFKDYLLWVRVCRAAGEDGFMPFAVIRGDAADVVVGADAKEPT